MEIECRSVKTRMLCMHSWIYNVRFAWKWISVQMLCVFVCVDVRIQSMVAMPLCVCGVVAKSEPQMRDELSKQANTNTTACHSMRCCILPFADIIEEFLKWLL